VDALDKIGLAEADFFPVRDFLAAVSVGILKDGPALDLCYLEDSSAIVDMNLVMTGGGSFVEVQGTGEQAPFSRQQLDAMLQMGEEGIRQLMKIQREVLGSLAERVGN
jgi:ribonuclease PH